MPYTQQGAADLTPGRIERRRMVPTIQGRSEKMSLHMADGVATVIVISREGFAGTNELQGNARAAQGRGERLRALRTPQQGRTLINAHFAAGSRRSAPPRGVQAHVPFPRG